jgi:hypothetical protein
VPLMMPDVNGMVELVATFTTPLSNVQNPGEVKQPELRVVTFSVLMVRILGDVLRTRTWKLVGWMAVGRLNVPLLNCEEVMLNKVTVFANAAVGRATAKSVNIINRRRRILIPSCRTFSGPQSQ